MSCLLELLNHAAEGIKQPNKLSSVHVIIGNDSCDLDSVASAIALAHYYAATNPSSLALPLLNCHREDLSLRQDIIWLLQHLDIDSTHLLFLPEVDIPLLPNPTVTLVDHNVPDEMLRPYVNEIIDHHDDAQTIDCSRVIEPVGSCSTLVGERLIDSEEYSIPTEIATLLLAAILIDTGNLKVEERFTDKDCDIAAKLEPLVAMTPDQLFFKVLTAREDVTDLTALQILRKDFKKSQVGKFSVGFSSMTLLVTDLISTRTDVSNDMEVFANQQGLHLLVLLSIQLKPLRRQIALYQPPNLPVDYDLVDSVAATLEVDSHLQVERIGEGMFDGIIMEQGNTSLSRKQILPIITGSLSLSDEKEETVRIHGFPRSNTLYLEDALAPLLIEEELKEEDNKKEENGRGIKEAEDESQPSSSHQGSLLQLESISARLGESMDSFALAQDSDHENSPSVSPSASLTNLADHSSSSVEDKSISQTIINEQPPSAPPLEPEIIMVSSSGSVSSPAVLPSEPPEPPVPEYTPEEENDETRSFRFVSVGGEQRRISLKLIEPYRPIIQHGGYLGNEQTAVIVISAFYLPPKNLRNYPQVISQTFFYVLSVLDQLVVDDYIIVYLHSGAPRNSMPGIQWFHRFYRMIDRRLRKNLKQLNIVHPTFWVKTMLRLLRPFISRKFYRKVHYIESLNQLNEYVKLDSMMIPDVVRRADQDINPSLYTQEPTASVESS